MLIWLDTATDKQAHPNENFARECMELFTLGIGNYTEADVRDAARAFTGWTIDPTSLSWVLRPRQHDDGQKTVLGQTGDWGGEDVVHILVNSPASHAWIVARVWSHFAYPVTTSDPVVKDLVPGYAKDRNISNLMRAVLLHPQFTSTLARTGLVKQPIEWTVGALRALGLPTGSRDITALTAQGQVPLRPPSVGGWPQNDYWLTTASSMARLSRRRVSPPISLTSRPSRRSRLPERVDAVAHLLSVTWTPATAKARPTSPRTRRPWSPWPWSPPKPSSPRVRRIDPPCPPSPVAPSSSAPAPPASPVRLPPPTLRSNAPLASPTARHPDRRPRPGRARPPCPGPAWTAPRGSSSSSPCTAATTD